MFEQIGAKQRDFKGGDKKIFIFISLQKEWIYDLGRSSLSDESVLSELSIVKEGSSCLRWNSPSKVSPFWYFPPPVWSKTIPRLIKTDVRN